jgi:hypothetical protein
MTNYNHYNVDIFYDFTIDKYCYLFDDFQVSTIKGENYKCNLDYNLIEFTPLEIQYFIRNKKLSKHITKKINKLFEIKSEYFFKLSNRSPKDILEKGKLEILDDDHRTIKTEKKIKQLNILKVKNIDDINFLLYNSNRCIEDILEYNKDITKKLYLVFQEWRPNLGKSVEYRCFINNNKLIGICLYKPEYYSSRSIIPVEIIQHFINQMLQLFQKINLDRYILDCFIFNDNPNKVYFIEINPFNEYIDTFSFDYDILNNTEYLLITL